MSDQALVALAGVCEATAAALADIARPLADPPPPLPLLRADLDSLLALVDNTALKLALALKPSAPAYSAALPLLHDLAQHVAALAHAVRLLHDFPHGAALTKDVRFRISDILAALRALIQTFLNNAARGPQLAGSDPSGDEHLVRTGALHDLISNARALGGIPDDNRAAVHKFWKSDNASLDDNLQEIATLVTDAQRPHHDDLDDGWDEIGLGSAGTALDETELARAKNVHSVLRLTTLLHKRIALDLLPLPSAAPPATFDTLLSQSNQLLSTADDLVAALYSPQELPCVRREILQIATIATSLRSLVDRLLPSTDDLSERLDNLTVDTSSPSKKKRADKKWFDTCVDHIHRLCTVVAESTGQADGTALSP